MRLKSVRSLAFEISIPWEVSVDTKVLCGGWHGEDSDVHWLWLWFSIYGEVPQSKQFRDQLLTDGIFEARPRATPSKSDDSAEHCIQIKCIT